ncbi:general substrate transporter [Cokeromyces recurvatus]|uniref:general substrate transporter n=1 Tax=Cokeromyces recurvatus TaxID=90255 RepID=UPI0022206778|nr:general substrate transporter [Cokeromyces recurvatus]KAI7905351.1 general substrate transporter [Cokeromyces recurvatus]
MPDTINLILETTPLLTHSPILKTTLFKKPVYLYATIAAIGGFVCGYDTGSISGIILLPTFQKQYFINNSLPYYESMLLTSFLATSMCGAFFSGYFCDRIGRKYSMILASILLWLGILCQILGLNISLIIFGRLMGGLGTGIMTNAIPLYQTEIAPPNIRGRLISIFSLLVSFGQMMGYFVTFGSSYLQSHWCWRLPWLMQLVICFIYIIAICFLPFSPRWLINEGKEIEGLQVLSRIYNLPQDHKTIKAEFLEIKTTIEAERLLGQIHSYAELFNKKGSSINRTIYAFFISIATCFTGNIMITYYAPQLFKNAGLSNVSASIASTGGIGLLSLICTALSLQWWIDLWDRRSLFLIGSFISCICMFVIGFMFHFYAIVVEDGKINLPVIVSDMYASWTIIFCMYLFSASFAGTWSVANYVYTTEIFSIRCRAKGLSLTYAISWAGSIIITYCVPFFLTYTISGVFFFFGICSILTFIGIGFIPETKGKTLEQIDFMFNDHNK